MKNDFWRESFWISSEADNKAEPISTFDERGIMEPTVMGNNGANSCSAN